MSESMSESVDHLRRTIRKAERRLASRPHAWLVELDFWEDWEGYSLGLAEIDGAPRLCRFRSNTSREDARPIADFPLPDCQRCAKNIDLFVERCDEQKEKLATHVDELANTIDSAIDNLQ